MVVKLHAKHLKIRGIVYWIYRNTLDLFIFLLSIVAPQHNRFLVSSDGGRRYSDNPRYFYEWITQNTSEEIYWITSIRDSTKKKGFVYKYSLRGICLIASSSTFVCSHSQYGSDILNFIPKKKKLVVIWHGTPVKHMLNIPPSKFRQLIHAKVSPDCFFVQSRLELNVLSEKFHIDKEIFRIAPYPRVDALRREYSPGKVLVWAPTFRDDRDQNWMEEFVYPERDEWILIDKYLKSKDLTLVVKEHPYSASSVGSLVCGLSNIQVAAPADDINQFLIEAQVLITDYSSVFFDFLAIGGRVAFFVPDIEWYSDINNRGLLPSFQTFLEGSGCGDFIGAITSSMDSSSNIIKELTVSNASRASGTASLEIYTHIKEQL